VNISDRLRDLALDIRQYYSEPIMLPRDELRGWADHLDRIAAEVEQSEWDRYDAIIAKDLSEMD
jgi:hypothetical protein